MNYIKKLQQELNDLQTNNTNAETLIQEFRQHIRSDKFIGTDLDGSRKDWISTSDVEIRLQNILDSLRGIA